MRFVGAHKAIYGASVSITPDATYFASWLTDGQPQYPVKTTGSFSAAISFTSQNIDVVAVTHHNIVQAATISLSGGISGSIATAAVLADSIPRNWRYLTLTPAAASSFTIGVTGNGGPVIIGEVFAGLSSVFPDLLAGRRLTPSQPFLWEGEYASLAPFDPGVSAQRRVSGTVVLTDAEFDELDAVFISQKVGSRPVLWLDNDTVNDAWLCQFHYEATHEELKHFVSLEITEIPRTSW
jgi:hypothetical protein